MLPYCYDTGTFVSTVAFDPVRNMFYVGTPHDSPTSSYLHGLVAFKIFNNCTIAKAWNTVVGTNSNNAANSVWPSPVVAGGLVFLGTGLESSLYALDADTGALLWTAPQTLGVTYSSPSVVDGHLFISDCGPSYNGQGTFWAYALANATPKPTFPPTRGPTLKPTKTPTLKPAKSTAVPIAPSVKPVTRKPTCKPTGSPSVTPTVAPV